MSFVLKTLVSVILCVLVLSSSPCSSSETTWQHDRSAGSKAYELGSYSEAARQFEAALKKVESGAAQETDIALCCSLLANAYKAQGRYPEAEPLHKRSLAISEKVLGPDHPAVATSLNNLAELYRTQGRYPEAEPLYKRALAIKKKRTVPIIQK